MIERKALERAFRSKCSTAEMGGERNLAAYPRTDILGPFCPCRSVGDHPGLPHEQKRWFLRQKAWRDREGEIAIACKPKVAIRTVLPYTGSSPTGIGQQATEGRRLSPGDQGSRMFSSRNKLLAALSQPEADLLSSDLQKIDLVQGQVIAQASVPLSHVYFIESGVVEETREEAGHSVAVGLIGAEGGVGIQVALGVREAFHRATVTLAGQAQRIELDRFDAACKRCPELLAGVLRFAHSMSLQLAETVWGTARLSVDTRLARYLSMLGDRAEGRPMKITHEALATSLGVRRPGVTVAMHYLEGDHLIKATRGLITILDPVGLRARGNRRDDRRAKIDAYAPTNGHLPH